MQLTRVTWAGVALFTAALAFYVLTLQPSLAWGDGAKIQREAVTGESFVLAEMVSATFAPDPFPFARLGVAAWDHPLYTILTHSATRLLPWLDALWLVNLASAIFGAGVVAGVYALIWDHTRSLPAAVLAAAALAVSHTFWFHAATPEVYTLVAYLIIAGLWALLRYRTNGRRPWLLAGAFGLGLAASTHMLAFIALPAFGLYWLLRPRNQSAAQSTGGQSGQSGGRLQTIDWPLAALAFVAGFGVYLVQLARMLRTFPIDRVLGPAVGTTFLSQLAKTTPLEVAASVLTFGVYLILQFNPAGVTLGALGLWRGRQARGPLWRAAVAGLTAYGLFGILYRVSDQFAFFLPAYLFFALAIGLGLAEIWRPAQAADFAPGRSGSPRSAWVVRAFMAGIALAPMLYGLAPGAMRAAGLDDASLGIPIIGTGIRDGLAYYINPNKRGDDAAYRFGAETIERLPPESLVLAEWYTDTDEYFVLRYFIVVEGRRPDVEVVGWPTEDPFHFDSSNAVRLVEEAIGRRPVYLASLSESFYAASTLAARYCIAVEHQLYRLLPAGSAGVDCLVVP